MSRLFARAVVCICAVHLAGHALAQGVFQEVEPYPQWDSFTPTAISDDGLVVVGDLYRKNGFPDGWRAVRWTAAAGYQVLNNSFYVTRAHGTNADGSVIVGQSWQNNVGTPFRWESVNGMQNVVGIPAGYAMGTATDVSADGSVIVGWSTRPTGEEAFRVAAGNFQALGDLPGGLFRSNANAVSADGSVVVGFSRSSPQQPPPIESGTEAFRWNQAGGMLNMWWLPGATVLMGTATAVTPGGEVIVGSSGGSNGEEAFRWTQATGMQGLGDLPLGQFRSQATAVSEDGSVVVGWSYWAAAPNQDSGSAAFIWSESSGMVHLKDVLENEFGVDLTGWSLRAAIDMSADGKVIVGHGWLNPNNRVWIARLNAPASCFGDANNDGIVNFDDITEALAAWGKTYFFNTSGLGDADHDGVVGFDDINAVLADWLNDCP